MIIVIEGLDKTNVKKHWGELSTKLNNAVTLIGNDKWTYIDWMNYLLSYEDRENVIVLDSWMHFRAEARLDGKTPLITDSEALLLDHFVEQKFGHIDFITNMTEEETMKTIEKDYGCLEEHAKKIFNEITYEVLQAKMFVMCNAVMEKSENV